MYFKRIITNFNNRKKEEHCGHIPIVLLQPVLETLQSSLNRTNILLQSEKTKHFVFFIMKVEYLSESPK